MTKQIEYVPCPICGETAYKDVVGLYHCKNGHYYRKITGNTAGITVPHLVRVFPLE
jgi:hypothetical protein